MDTQKNIKIKFERSEKALTLKPAMGFGKKVSVTKITSGLSCEIKEGNWVLKTDMPEQVGGNTSAPTPGTFGRAALGACLASGYMMWASKLDIPIESLEIRIEADFDDGGMFGTSSSLPGYSEVRYHVKINSPLSLYEIEKFLDKADKHSPYLDVFSRAQPCVRHVEVINN
jgi:uncharacterized OsmC-like protein